MSSGERRAAADVDEGADEVADHVVEEAGAGDAVDEEVVRARCQAEAKMVRMVLAAARCESCWRGAVRSGSAAAKEVKSWVPRRWAAACCMAVEVEGPAAVPDVRGEEGGADAVVGIWRSRVAECSGVRRCGTRRFCGGRCGGRGSGGDVVGGEDADAGGEGAVEGAEEVGGGDGGVEGEGGDLREGVDAGVGAAGALGENGLAGDVVEGVGEGALDGGQAGLDLPAVEGGAVVARVSFQ